MDSIGSATTRFPLLTCHEIENLPDLEWVVRGVLPEQAFGVLYGEPGSAKSFVALSIALACASGVDWLGRSTKRMGVLYVAAEGVLGLKNRLRAHGHRRGPTANSLRFVASPVLITDPTQAAALLESLEVEDFSPGLIVIDTLARVMLDLDENSAKDMGQVVNGLDELKRATSATMLIIHHTNKEGSSERGSGALRGAADVMIKCQKDSSSVTLTCDKMKDDEPFRDIGATLEKVELADGASSLVVGEPFDIIALNGESADAIVQVLEHNFAESGASLSQLVEAYRAETGKSKSTFFRAWRDLKNTKRVRLDKANGKVVIFPAGVSVSPVSNQCQTPTQVSVMSPPSLGGDTDTKSNDTPQLSE